MILPLEFVIRDSAVRPARNAFDEVRGNAMMDLSKQDASFTTGCVAWQAGIRLLKKDVIGRQFCEVILAQALTKNGALTSVSTPFKTKIDLITKKDSWQPQGSSRPEEDNSKTYTLKDHKFHHPPIDLPQRPVRGHPL